MLISLIKIEVSHVRIFASETNDRIEDFDGN